MLNTFTFHEYNRFAVYIFVRIIPGIFMDHQLTASLITLKDYYSPKLIVCDFN